MTASRSAPLHLCAVVPASESPAIRSALPRLGCVPCGPVAAVTARWGPPSTSRAALRHARILGRLLAACSSVVPFRFGVELASETELRELLELNLDALCRCLARVGGRVEMGARVKLPAWGPAAARLKSGLGPIRALVPSADDRRERLQQLAGGRMFEGCYLIARQKIEAFWSAVDESRSALGELPILGSGPWAAYSFCEVVLRPGPVLTAQGW